MIQSNALVHRPASFLLILVAFAITAWGPAKLRAADAARPNILYFYVDDMGWGSIGPNGQARRKAAGEIYVKTPSIDKLAREGINFTRGYGCHVCSPARSSQQTGFHQGHTFADRNDPNNAKKAIRAEDITMGDALSAAGYVTGYWGKWGYGGSKAMASPVIENVQTLPTSHGYQHVLAELHHVRAHTFFQPTLWHAPAKTDSAGGLALVANSMAAYRDGDVYPQTPAGQSHVDYPQTAYCDDSYALATLDFVRRQGMNYNESGQPFFGLFAAQIPHAPFDEIAQLPQWDHAYADDPRFGSLANTSQRWAAMVSRIDAHIGNILAALDDPNNDGDTSDSIASNTLVVFQSDNGGPGGSYVGELDANGGLRGTKGKIYEGGIRVPLVVRWPDKITPDSTLSAGSNSDRVLDVTDLLPTFCELAGTDSPLGIDGVSIAPTLLGKGQQRGREFIIHEANDGQSIIRGDRKLIIGRRSTVELYDLTNDPSESNNIAADNEALVDELKQLLEGERVFEPRGFANTYHRWTGDDGEDASDVDNWSDYRYSNAGVTYLSDDGPPQMSWVAQIDHSGSGPQKVRANSDLEFLALQIQGDSKTQSRQTLALGAGVNLMGRNEIRLGAHSVLSVNGGTVSSLRWIDVAPDAVLQGHGSIDATIYNRGDMLVTGEISIGKDFYQSPAGTLSIRFDGVDARPLEIAGVASLGGDLSLLAAKSLALKPGQQRTLLTANRIEGKFANSGGVIEINGEKYMLHYTRDSVVICQE
ncbi:sulfatase-like hydrolase/transferase [Planctomycetes bacterium K23_9]|uniref:Arylsulfatase n=1 Tax=Stieleria marina TaxID=1930275 RepID=A0A517NT31_9BACT|nr:Arylsulfatase [Planctomycetes bacterium K23_9]